MPRPETVRQIQSTGKREVTTALERLTGFVPTDVVAVWGAAVGLLAPERAILYLAALVFLTVLLLIEMSVQDKGAGIKTDGRPKLLMIMIAVLAFTVWAFATPGSPVAAQWGAHTMRYFGVLAIAVSAVLFRLDSASRFSAT